MKKGAIAAGHIETAKAAEEILRVGGNAFDAAVAAQFAACVAEPVLSSLGGGGFLFADPVDGSKIVYDYFVQTPLNPQKKNVEFNSIIADFGFAQQEFHIGTGSMATPGLVKGLYAVHNDLCTLPMKQLVEPAVKLAREGVIINEFQAEVFEIIKPIYLSTKESRSVFGGLKSTEELLGKGDVLKLPDWADFLEALSKEGEDLFYRGEVSAAVDKLSRERSGFLERKDFEAYQVKKRKPLCISYGRNKVYMNPPPSSGGVLVAFALKLLSSLLHKERPTSEAGWAMLNALLQGTTEKARVDALAKITGTNLSQILDSSYLENYREEILDKKESFRGTTHISIIDGDGNVASLTVSNGEGSGLLIPGTNIMMNNMLGEEDLNPNGFHRWTPNSRMTSMMTPGVAEGDETGLLAFGSGGSTRIRTAILQLLIQIFDRNRGVEDAVMAPRLHVESGFLHIENGLTRKTVSKLRDYFPNNRCWDRKSLFFGGTHVSEKRGKTYRAVGDPRRGGVSIVL